MDSKITAGKWTVEPGCMYEFEHLAVFSGIAKIADVLHGPDARLIAAAPQLLEACKDLLLRIGMAAMCQDTILPNDETLIKARAAIAKAEGRQST
jgi:hypothetical protein